MYDLTWRRIDFYQKKKRKEYDVPMDFAKVAKKHRMVFKVDSPARPLLPFWQVWAKVKGKGKGEAVSRDHRVVDEAVNGNQNAEGARPCRPSASLAEKGQPFLQSKWQLTVLDNKA